MFEPNSRYYKVETAITILPDGREVAYKRRRFLPMSPNPTASITHEVTEGERLDLITARYLKDPERFWQICDVNQAMHPDELTAEIGRKLVIDVLGI